MSSKNAEFKVLRFMGLTLGGGKGRKTALCILDYFVEEQRLFLSELHDSFDESQRLSVDTQLVRLIEKNQKNLKLIAVDAPLKLPKCMRCRLVCPGIERCEEPEIKWMWKWHKKRSPEKRPNKIFTAYTERCVEQFIASEIHPEISSDHAFGSNRAPLSARALFLKRRLAQSKMIEVLPKLSVWVLGQEIGVRNSRLLQYKNITEGAEIRQNFLSLWAEEDRCFIYQRDLKTMISDLFVFESFICAYTAYLQHMGECEPRPKGFPSSESWIAYPRFVQRD